MAASKTFRDSSSAENTDHNEIKKSLSSDSVTFGFEGRDFFFMLFCCFLISFYSIISIITLPAAGCYLMTVSDLLLSTSYLLLSTSYFLLTDCFTIPTITQITMVTRMSTTVLPIGRSIFISFL